MNAWKGWPLWLLLLLSLGVNLGVLAARWAGPSEQGRRAPEEARLPRRGMPAPLFRLLRELGLEGQERETFLALQEEFLNRLVDGRKEVQELQGRLRRQLTSKQPDREEIDGLLEDLARAYVSLESAFVDDLLSSRDLLNPRQERIYLGFMRKVRQAKTAELQRHLRGRVGQWRRDQAKERPRG